MAYPVNQTDPFDENTTYLVIPEPSTPPDFAAIATAFAAKYGATLIPVKGKELPSPMLWRFFVNKPMDEQPWEEATGFAVVCGQGGYRCIDVDQCAPEQIEKVAGAILDALGFPRSYPWLVITDTGFHLWFRTPDAKVEKHDVMEWRGWGEFEEAFQRIELRYANAYALVPPSQHPSGSTYHFVGGVAPEQPPTEVEDFITLTNALCKVSYYDDKTCGGCYRRYEACICTDESEDW